MNPRIETRYGTLEGVEEDGLRVFRGVPFARSPVGSLRWCPPEPPAPWSGTRDASRCGPAAPQNGSILIRFQGLRSLDLAEDCLTLNAWTPGLDTARRPVLVWIHGGAFRSGSSCEPVYDPTMLARRGNVVVVTFNYRLGALGFLAWPEPSRAPKGAANYGLLDQIMALRWVQEHAERLGGDPSNVTLVGQSAGAMSAATLLAVPRAWPFFQRVILQSGAAHNVSSPETAEKITEVFLKELGLSPEQGDPLRELPVGALLAAQQRTADRSARLASLTFQPYADGEVIPVPPLEAGVGRLARVPVLIGTNLDEWNLFGAADPRARTLDERRLRRRLERVLGPERTDGEAWLEALHAAYGAKGSGAGATGPAQLWFGIESDRYFHAPAVQLADRLRAEGNAVYRYLFTWRSPALGGVLGACHGLEIPFVFGGLHQPALARFAGGGAAAERLRDQVQWAWVAFARSADPNHAGLPPWPLYQPGRKPTMRLGAQCKADEAPLRRRHPFWAAFS